MRLALTDNQRHPDYDLSVFGPNGFLRVFKGSIAHGNANIVSSMKERPFPPETAITALLPFALGERPNWVRFDYGPSRAQWP
jgi:hypothetical protein